MKHWHLVPVSRGPRSSQEACLSKHPLLFPIQVLQGDAISTPRGGSARGGRSPPTLDPKPDGPRRPSRKEKGTVGVSKTTGGEQSVAGVVSAANIIPADNQTQNLMPIPAAAVADAAAASPLKITRVPKPALSSSLVSTPRPTSALLNGESSQRSLHTLSDLCADDDEAMCRVPAPEEAEDPCMPAGQVIPLDLDLDPGVAGSSGI